MQRGHGVHSPFAFRLITTVICNPGTYYAYPLLESVARDEGIAPERIKLLFRLICEFAPSEVSVPSTLSTAERTAILAADSRIRLTGTPASVSYCHTVPSTLPAGGVVIVADPPPGSIKALTSRRSHGMVFTHRGLAVIVMRHDLPPQTFNL